MRAHAQIVADLDPRGRTRLVRLRGQTPLLLRQAGGDRPATVYIVGGAASPLGGDDLRLDIEVRAGAAVRVRAVAASVALPGPAGAPSSMAVTALVEAGARLEWLPEQTVAAAGCRHRATSTVTLADGAALRWRDELVCGRHGESSGSVVVATAVTYAGRPLLRQSLTVGPDAPGWAGPAVLGGARTTGTLLAVEPGAGLPPEAVADRAATVRLAGGPATLRTAIAPDAHTLRRLLDA